METAAKRIVLFASGTGSNARKIIEHFQRDPRIEVVLLLSNNPSAKALEMAASFDVPTRVFNRSEFHDADVVLRELLAINPDLIVLAGFLWLIPTSIVRAFPQRIINIHPALLPKFGGKGMYGHHVHEAVVAAGERKSGPTIHFVNEAYDEGAIIFQATCAIDPTDTADQVARKVLSLEHKHFPLVIERLLFPTE